MKHLPSTLSCVVPHTLQKYDTAGDYAELDGRWFITVSALPDWRMEALVFLHEFVEMCLTKNSGVDWGDITKFDVESGHDDPGSLETAPYHKEHIVAEQLEKKFAELLGIEWSKYNEALDALKWRES